MRKAPATLDVADVDAQRWGTWWTTLPAALSPTRKQLDRLVDARRAATPSSYAAGKRCPGARR
jgi:hypothetical protein